MDLYTSIGDLAQKVGWQSDTILTLWTWFFAVRWLVDIVGTAVAILVLAQAWNRFKNRKKKD